jgi:hypothetical protein
MGEDHMYHIHYLPALILGFFGRKKNIECSLPAANQQNTSRTEMSHFTNKEMTPMTMSAMVAICPIWLLWLAKC